MIKNGAFSLFCPSLCHFLLKMVHAGTNEGTYLRKQASSED